MAYVLKIRHGVAHVNLRSRLGAYAQFFPSRLTSIPDLHFYQCGTPSSHRATSVQPK